jgi:hypothetical protein
MYGIGERRKICEFQCISGISSARTTLVAAFERSTASKRYSGVERLLEASVMTTPSCPLSYVDGTIVLRVELPPHAVAASMSANPEREIPSE